MESVIWHSSALLQVITKPMMIITIKFCDIAMIYFEINCLLNEMFKKIIIKSYKQGLDTDHWVFYFL